MDEILSTNPITYLHVLILALKYDFLHEYQLVFHVQNNHFDSLVLVDREANFALLSFDETLLSSSVLFVRYQRVKNW